MTLVPWARGRCLLWDATCPDTLAPSHVSNSSTEAGSAGKAAESKKIAKYSTLAAAHEFVPVAIETMGTWGACGLAFVNEICRRISEANGDPRSTAFLKLWLSLAVQSENAASVIGTLSSALTADEQLYNSAETTESAASPLLVRQHGINCLPAPD